MIKKFCFACSMFLAFNLQIHAATDSVSIDTVDNYNGWGWEVVVIKNSYITLGIVPSIGGRVLQYDLGVDTFMIINDGLKGMLWEPNAGYTNSPWSSWGYGGYKTWPAPQSEWSWPPPPFMAWGVYEYETTHASVDSVVVWLKGQTEVYQVPGLRFDRFITVYRNSTRVKVETILFNDNTTEESWSIWDVTQTIVEHENKNDFTNFSAYIPITSSDDIWYADAPPSCNEVLPGIYQVKFTNQSGKMYSTAAEGWSCFVDERDKQCYAKIFDLVEGADYPDQGTNVQYYSNGGNDYLEMEILGPIEAISPNGGSISFTEDWYATRSEGPMYSATHAGIVKTPLSFNRAQQSLMGEIGVFNEGTLSVFYLTADRNFISDEELITVFPDNLVQLNEIIDVPDNADIIELVAYDVDGNFIASLTETVVISNNDYFTALKAATESTVDGIADEAFWDSATWYPLDYIWLPWGDEVTSDDFTGKFKISWNDNKLLLLVEIVDDSLYDGHTQPLDNYWNDDCVEVFVDEDHSGGNHLNNFNAFAYHCAINEVDIVDNNTTGSALFNDDIDFAWINDEDTFIWELAVNIFDNSYVYGASNTPVTLTNNKEIGFSLAYCDNDGSASRENFIGSKFLEEAVSNNSYIDATLFGKLTLIDPNAGGEPLPEANFSANVTNGEIPLSVNFTDLSSGNVTSWAWDFGDGTISSEQNPDHTYSEVGSYDVSLTVSGIGGVDTETKAEYIGAFLSDGISTYGQNPEYSIYPNPANDVLYLSHNIETGLDLNYSIRSLTGQSVMTGTVSQNDIKGSIEIGSLKSGMYLIELLDKESVYTDQFIKE